MLKASFNTGHRIFLGALACIVGIPIAKGDFLRDGREAFMKYDFESASENYEKYAKGLKKNPDGQGEELLEMYRRQLDIAENSLENVQKIEIIDRIDVPAEEFFKYIKLPAQGGKLLSPNASVLNKRHNQSDYAFSTESGDVLMWSENDENHKEVIMECERLMDGSWDKPVSLGDILNDGGNARNPFLLTDGVTLYYSSDGEGSMGGFDLFVATKDSEGEFRQPIGLGYPFNSPYNEYAIAIDEENGIGWWVTDRNNLDGQVSIYIFKTNEVRKNYVTDEEDDIISLARVSDISLTQNPDTDYASILKGIEQRSKTSKENIGADFIFPLPGGKVAKRLSDFSTASAKRNMQQYLEALKDHQSVENKLTELRKRYHSTDHKSSASSALKNQILELESKRDKQEAILKQMRNAIITSEAKQ